MCDKSSRANISNNLVGKVRRPDTLLVNVARLPPPAPAADASLVLLAVTSDVVLLLISWTASSAAGVEFVVMNTGFTWDTQNKEADTAAAQATWQESKRMLADSSIDLVLLDELTYMVTYGYVDLDEVVTALNNRPPMQSVIITGRAAHRTLTDLADTVSEVRNVKHAFDSGIKALEGFDY